MEQNNVAKVSEKPNSFNPTLIFSGLLLSAILFAADQISKNIIRNYVLENDGSVEVLPFFNLVYVWNEGVSFGMFQSETYDGVFMLIVIASIITTLFFIILLKSDNLFTALACGTIIGGSAGNIYDRVHYHAVYDFLDFHMMGYHWPAFNIADTCVVIGIAMIAYDSLFLSPKSEKKS